MMRRALGRRVLLVAAHALIYAATPLAALAQQPPAARGGTQAGAFTPLRSDGNGVAALARTVSVDVTAIEVESVLQDIARQADIGITYSRDLPGLGARITMRAAGISAAAALLQLLANTSIAPVVSSTGQLVLTARAEAARVQTGTIAGVIRDSVSGAAIADARVEVVGTALSARSGADGRFIVRNLPVGTVVLAVQRLGFRPARRAGVTVIEGAASEHTIAMHSALVPLASVVVTPAHFGVMQQTMSAHQTLSRDDIESSPQLGEDTFRAMTRLPGLVSTDFSAAFRVRGGANSELHVSLDGLQLYEPFHLKDFDGALSIVDVGAVGGIDLTTGGFGVRYGDKLTGVMQMRSTEPALGETRTTLGLSITNLRAMSRGTFANNRGRWLASGRRGYLDYMLRMSDADTAISPTYWDALGKMEFDVSPTHTFGAHLLAAGDRMTYDEDGSSDPGLRSEYGSNYGWFTWRGAFGSRVEGTAALSVGRLTWNRVGEHFANDRGTQDVSVFDDRAFTVVGLRQDWSATFGERALLSWGLDVRSMKASYDYFGWKRRFVLSGDSALAEVDTVDVDASPSGTVLGAYIAQRVRPWQMLTAEAGVRYDRHSYTGDDEVLPRLNLELAPPVGPTVRAAWGRFSQAQGIYEMQVQDGVDRFFPAEVAEHRMLGLEQPLGARTTLRVEGYERRTSRVRPYFTNLYNHINTFPELEADRHMVHPERGVARGLELFVKQEPIGRFGWSASYALSSSKDRVEGQWIPRPFDQRHTVVLDATWRPSPPWRITAAWQRHSGWPYTSAGFVARPLKNGGTLLEPTFGPLLTTRLPSYARVDARATRTFRTRRGDLLVFVDIFNLLNSTNVRAYEYSINVNGGQVRVFPRGERQLPRLPTFGLTWEF